MDFPINPQFLNFSTSQRYCQHHTMNIYIHTLYSFISMFISNMENCFCTAHTIALMYSEN